jgi:hypothetical protein
MLNTKVLSATPNPGGSYTVTVESSKDKQQQKLETDALLVCIGRRPYTANLGLKEIGVETDEKGRVKINDHFLTNIPSIRAIGDVIAGPMLAHKAEEEGKQQRRRWSERDGYRRWGLRLPSVYFHVRDEGRRRRRRREKPEWIYDTNKARERVMMAWIYYNVRLTRIPRISRSYCSEPL